MRIAVGVWALVVLGVAGCSCASEPGLTDTGVSIDAARPDVGPVGDARVTPDAGLDARATDTGLDALGATDTGVDAASTVDTGIDAGTDAAIVTTDAGRDGGSDAGHDAAIVTFDAGGCTSDASCLTTEFCAFPTGTCGGTGTCTSRGIGRFCVMTCAPECGCDGTTYQNTCYRQRAGTSLRATGVCPGTVSPCGVTTCGCAADGDCARNEECVTTPSGGVCKMQITRPMCWRDSDCNGGPTCHGARVCPCGAACFVADAPGTCG